jgi:ADP-ribose pyrophosphatase YjhB (NUDIX family)
LSTIGYAAEYTHPAVLAAIAAGEPWADPEMDPTRIDWAARLAASPLPFEIIDGRPYCRQAHLVSGIRYGRGWLGHWGPQQCADAVVLATDPAGIRHLLMIERRGGDGTSGWALPGGYIDPGETALAAAVRELYEETGLTVPDDAWVVGRPRFVPDPRCTAESWMVTTPATADLGRVDRLPHVAGSDDARQAAWITATSYHALAAHLADVYGGAVFAAHRELLADVLR